jgi:hypothetical protein
VCAWLPFIMARFAVHLLHLEPVHLSVDTQPASNNGSSVQE